MMTATTSQRDNHLVMTLQGDIIGAESERLRTALAKAIGQAKRGSGVILDMNGVPMISTSALGALVAGYAMTRQKGCHLAVVGAGRKVLGVLGVLELKGVFRMYESMDDALRSLNETSPQST